MSMHPTQPDLRGDVVVITGATGAIGRATTELFLHHGATVAALGRNPERLRDLETLGARVWRLDLLDIPTLAEVADRVHDQLGPATSLLAFAGGNGLPSPTSTESLDHWRQVLDDDLTTTFATVKAFLPHLRSRPGSSIVTMSSSAALRPGMSNAAYAAAKAGVIGLTRHWAREFQPDGIRVNCLAPGTVDNDRLAQLSPAQREHLASKLPMQRIGHPRDVAHAALHLTSPLSAYTTGAVLELGGPSL